jgi:hypothetical protein
VAALYDEAARWFDKAAKAGDKRFQVEFPRFSSGQQNEKDIRHF